jgi:hypothetical protein
MAMIALCSAETMIACSTAAVEMTAGKAAVLPRVFGHRGSRCSVRVRYTAVATC